MRIKNRIKRLALRPLNGINQQIRNLQFAQRKALID